MAWFITTEIRYYGREYLAHGFNDYIRTSSFKKALTFETRGEAELIRAEALGPDNEWHAAEVVYGIWSRGIKGWARIADSTGDMEAHRSWRKPVMTFNTKAEAEFVVAPYNSKKKHFQVVPWILSSE